MFAKKRKACQHSGSNPSLDRLEITQVKTVTALNAIATSQLSAPAGSQSVQSHDAQLKKVAHQFEAMFMTEMIRQTRPTDQAAGAFAPGRSQETWSVFMDQALGQAATVNGPAGDGSLRHAIEKAVRDADGHANQGKIK